MADPGKTNLNEESVSLRELNPAIESVNLAVISRVSEYIAAKKSLDEMGERNKEIESILEGRVGKVDASSARLYDEMNRNMPQLTALRNDTEIARNRVIGAFKNLISNEKTNEKEVSSTFSYLNNRVSDEAIAELVGVYKDAYEKLREHTKKAEELKPQPETAPAIETKPVALPPIEAKSAMPEPVAEVKAEPELTASEGSRNNFVDMTTFGASGEVGDMSSVAEVSQNPPIIEQPKITAEPTPPEAAPVSAIKPPEANLNNTSVNGNDNSIAGLFDQKLNTPVNPVEQTDDKKNAPAITPGQPQSENTILPNTEETPADKPVVPEKPVVPQPMSRIEASDQLRTPVPVSVGSAESAQPIAVTSEISKQAPVATESAQPIVQNLEEKPKRGLAARIGGLFSRSKSANQPIEQQPQLQTDQKDTNSRLTDINRIPSHKLTAEHLSFGREDSSTEKNPVQTVEPNASDQKLAA